MLLIVIGCMHASDGLCVVTGTDGIIENSILLYMFDG